MKIVQNDSYSVFVEIKVVRNGILNNLYIYEKFLLCTVFPPGASQGDQTRKLDDFLYLTQLFSITPYNVLVGMNNVNNVICNNFVFHDQLQNMHRFLTRSL